MAAAGGRGSSSSAWLAQQEVLQQLQYDQLQLATQQAQIEELHRAHVHQHMQQQRTLRLIASGQRHVHVAGDLSPGGRHLHAQQWHPREAGTGAARGRGGGAGSAAPHVNGGGASGGLDKHRWGVWGAVLARGGDGGGAPSVPVVVRAAAAAAAAAETRGRRAAPSKGPRARSSSQPRAISLSRGRTSFEDSLRG